MFPEWRLSPFLKLGTGVGVRPAARHDCSARGPHRPDGVCGRGAAFYLTRRFFVRADYRWHTIFTSRDDNEELEEWKVQIACFF